MSFWKKAADAMEKVVLGAEEAERQLLEAEIREAQEEAAKKQK